MRHNKGTRKLKLSTGTIFVSEEEMRSSIGEFISEFRFDIQVHVRSQTLMELRQKMIQAKRHGKLKKCLLYFTCNPGHSSYMWFFSNNITSAKSFFDTLKTLDKYTF